MPILRQMAAVMACCAAFGVMRIGLAGQDAAALTWELAKSAREKSRAFVR